MLLQQELLKVRVICGGLKLEDYGLIFLWFGFSIAVVAVDLDEEKCWVLLQNGLSGNQKRNMLSFTGDGLSIFWPAFFCEP